jgi:hypothetical protein
LRNLGSVRRIASEIGRENVICEDRPDGLCFLHLEGIALCKGSDEDIENFLAAVRLSAKRYISNGPGPITGQEIGHELNLSPLASKRLAQILYRGSGFWSSGGWSSDSSEYHFNPSEEVVFYEHVATLNDYFEARNRVRSEALEASKQLWSREGLVAEPLTSEYAEVETTTLRHLGIRVALSDPTLQRIAERDLAELTQVLAIQAWKSAAILAGSCLEAILLDLWYRQEDTAKARWRDRWPHDVRAFELAEAAAEAGIISRNHKDLASTIRRARNLIHPAVEAREKQQPSRELTEALVAFLRLLVSELFPKDCA